MRRWLSYVSVFALIGLGTGLVSGPVAAQEEMATPEVSEERIVPPEECQVAPRPADEVFALLGLVEGATEAMPAADRTPVPAPPWVAADPETAAAVEDTTRAWLGCINADDNLRIAALMTDSAIVRFFGGGLTPDEAIEGARSNLAGTPVPRVEEEHVRLVAVTDASRLQDGRVAAMALINEPVLPPRGQETLLLIFVEAEGRLLIDDIVQFSVVPMTEGTPQVGTPQP
jgi:hypothetical protein